MLTCAGPKVVLEGENYFRPVKNSYHQLHSVTELCKTVRARLVIVLFFAVANVALLADANEDYAKIIAPLIDPAKLATLKDRGANYRVKKVVYWLEMAHRDTAQPAKVVDIALNSVGITNPLAAGATKSALLRNHQIAGKLGCLDAGGMNQMRQGKSPTVQRGPTKGQRLSVDHIIPRLIVPELDNVMANLELLPMNLNASKGAKITQRQLALAEQLNKAGLLSTEGLNAVRKAK